MQPRLGGPEYRLVERARQAVERHRMAVSDDSIIVAVSGGPDSTCLLDVMARLRNHFAWHLAAAHVDHGLAPESATVAARVAHDAAEAGFEVHMVRAPDLAGPNLQARARAFRYGFFETIAEQVGATKIATGHTLDDRVETTVARFVHGAGTDGLAGLRPTEGDRIRPLIDIRRSETRSYCEARDLEFVDDPANQDLRFERGFVRAKLIGSIEQRWGDGAVRAMATACERLSEDSAALESLAEALYGQLVSPSGEEASFDLQAFLSVPKALRRRMLELAVGRIRDRSGGIDAVLERLDRFEEPRGKDLTYAVAAGVEIHIGPNAVIVKKPPGRGD